jgi:uncharacterized protein (DUF1697 family)
VVTRRADEMDAVVRANPMAEMTVGSRLHVVFFVEPLAADVRAWLAREDFTPDSVSPAEREVYVWYEHGMSGSSTADRISGRLPRDATDRNWNTVTKLLAMAGEQPGSSSPDPRASVRRVRGFPISRERHRAPRSPGHRPPSPRPTL